jgi:glyoxylase-like metal-dependent hydrolase (beta-lactamase superfamily II)
MAAYMRSLELLLERDDRVYYPAHGPEIANPQDHVRRLVGHRRQRERQILRHVSAGEGSIPQMVAQMYRGIDPRLHPAAEKSVLAHLIDLEQRNMVVRSRDRWQLAG